MAFSIDEFRSSIDRQGLAYQSHYDVMIVPPPVIGDVESTRDIMVRVEAAEKPGRGILTIDSRYWGPFQRVGYEASHTDVTLGVLCSADLRERDFFVRWQDLIVGRYRVAAGPGARINVFDLGYYDDYVGRVSVREYDDTGVVTSHTSLIEAYPVFVGPLSHAWSTVEALRVNVTLAYRYFEDVERSSPIGSDANAF